MPLNKLNLFKNSSVDKGEFLKNYWHKKPLLIRNAINESDLSILPNKSLLQQLSQHEDIQSRIAIKNNENDYTVEYGPFELSDFEQLENCRWNLLVSDIDKWHPISTNILKYFNFIRNWIFDDIMLSCGSRDGTVGPHTDHYDVFLIQVSGQRQWSFTHNKILNPELMPDQALKLMSDFNPDETIQLNPGDVLYLPPEVGHYGIASNDECVTCSIGMRTPSHAELLTSFVDCIAQKQSSNDRFEEPLFSIEPKKGEITAQDINRISSILKNKLESNNANISQWFGKYITEYRSLKLSLLFAISSIHLR